MPDADPLYWNVCCGRKRLFSDKLKGLGWSGEEDIGKDGEGRLHDHWEVE